jgi:hypothetical protein
VKRLRVCVFGNSHVGSLKQGWDQIAGEHGDVEMVFFASRASGLKDLRVADRIMVPSTAALAKDIAFTSGGLDRVDGDRFDVFLTYGLSLRLPRLDRRLSSAVRLLAAKEVFENSLNRSICRRVRQISAAPLFIGHDPQHARIVPRADEEHLMGYRETHLLFSSCLGIEDAVLLFQPAETIGNGWHTKAEFSVGSTRLDIGDEKSNEPHGAGDMEHMNGAFGRIYVEQFLTIAQASVQCRAPQTLPSRSLASGQQARA